MGVKQADPKVWLSVSARMCFSDSSSSDVSAACRPSRRPLSVANSLISPAAAYATAAGCTNCANVCSKTFFMEDEWGRARVRQQGVAGVEKLQEAIDCCPVSCIHWVSWQLKAES